MPWTAVFYFLLELVHQTMILTAMIGLACCNVATIAAATFCFYSIRGSIWRKHLLLRSGRLLNLVRIVAAHHRAA